MNWALIMMTLFIAWQVYGISQLFYPPTCQNVDTSNRCIKPLYDPYTTPFELRLYRARRIPRGSVSLDLFKEDDMFYSKQLTLGEGSWDNSSIVVPLYPNTRLNGSISVVIVLDPMNGKQPVLTAADLTIYKEVTKKEGTYLLARNGTEDAPSTGEWISHWKPTLTIRVVADDRVYDPVTKPFDIYLNTQGSKTDYVPYMYADELYLLKKHLRPLSNDTSRENPSITIKFRVTNIGIFRLLGQLQAGLGEMHKMGLGETETDEVLELMNPDRLYRLAATYTIAFLHMIFSYLAFRNEIGFWRKRETVEGLSATSIVGGAICTTIIFLFLLDNDTSYLVLGTMAISLLIDWWKVTKVVKCGRIETTAEKETQAHDAQGMRYLAYVLTPLVLGWSIYSLIYNTHRNFYSWFISSAANGVYAFGFILMTPQIFINYKLKSVAHLPWRAMCYKFFNTFVDDVLAFGILDMPTLHRLATLRDDMVFFIFLYQRWIYPVDYSRPNEFGYAYEDNEDSKSDLNKKET